MDLKLLLEKMDKFAGEPEQKPGDYLRGGEPLPKKGSKKHPALNKLVGAAEGQENLLKELEVQLKEGELERELTNELNFFKTAPKKTEPAPQPKISRITGEPLKSPTLPNPAGMISRSEDKVYFRDGMEFTLHREGNVFQFIYKGKVIQTFTTPEKYIHAHLIDKGFRLFSDGGKPQVKNPDWFAVEEDSEVITVSNPKDTVELDIPLVIRLLEYAREDAKTDMDLHNVAEKLISIAANGQTLTMADYDSIVGNDAEIDKEIAPAVATAGGPAGATQVNPQAAKVTDPAQAALLKQQQAKLQQNLANLKSAGVQIDPAKAAQTLQKTDTGAPMNAIDKDTISKLAPAIGNVMSNPSTATQLNTLIKKAGGGQ